MDALLAVDAGGTKCEALLVGPDGALLGWGLCRAEDPTSGTSWGGKGRSKESTLSALRRALGEHRPASLTVSGLGRWDVPELAQPYTPGEVRAVPVAEWDAPLALAGVDWGVVVLSGTGAFVHGAAPDGERLHLDSLGPLLGDYGSGSMIGWMALRAVARHHWSPRHETALTEAVGAVLGIDVHEKGLGRLVDFAHKPHDRAVVAQLARYVDEAARTGDAVASRILAEAAAAQAEVVRDVVDRLALAEVAFPLVAAGSVATRSALYWAHLCAAVAGFAPRAEPVVPAGPQVLGTALRALGRIGLEHWRERLRAEVLAASPRDAD